ncbi:MULTISPECIES: queuosine precursor transporter [Haloferax]|uniref:Probable queuosine precursor transporter n=2 Tax=Haloferax TaxID=2251 RepID=A0A6G1YZA5_9EURY|nr:MULTISPECIES: queuosine precursor transporter [Haloferax]KAB1186980.1 queuosine precursor transporter [Haloferax sp. CBA1149]MRW79610.1 queuosine precursor transporter [Haloferax marinisediminis]
MSEGQSNVGQVVLVGLFVTALTTAQLTASKLLAIPLPSALGELPVVGATIILPGAALAYALTFFASDCYSELYGRRPAQVMVNVGFAMNFVLLGLVWSTIAAPAANPEFAGQFADVLASGTNIVAGSLLAYLVSQNWDVIVFHSIRELTDGAFLWLRNIVSTATSQAIDTVIFVGVAFYVAPTVLGIGQALPRNVLVGLIVGQYLLKLLIAIVDTPFVYGVVALFGDESSASDDGWVVD